MPNEQEKNQNDGHTTTSDREHIGERSGDGHGGVKCGRRREGAKHRYLPYTWKQSIIKQHPSGLSLSLQGVPSSGECSRVGTDNDSSSQGSSGMAEQHQKDKETISVRILKELGRSTGTYLSDVVKCRDVQEANAFAECLQRGGKLFKRGLILVSTDADHVHVIHDCSFTTKTCRCGWFKKAEIMFGLRRRDRSSSGRPLCNSLRLTDVQNILKYFSIHQRRTTYLKIGGQLERLPYEDPDLEEPGLEERVREGLAVEGETGEENYDLPLFGEEYLDQRTAERNRRGREAISRKQKSTVGSKQVQRMEKMMKMFMEHPMCPVEGILNHPTWLLDKDLQFLNQSDREVQAVINNWTKQLCTWTIHDFNTLYSDENCKPIFGAGYGNISDYYYNVETSVKVLDDLVNYQCNEDPELVLAFMSDLFNILERKLPKLNTLIIISPASSGKNFFFDCIKDYYLNVGQISKLNKYNSFPVQDTEGRRLIFFNEPNYSDDYLETLKLLFGGDSTNVSVKYKKEAPVYRTPVIVTTNNTLTCMTDVSFRDRIRIYRWVQAPYLRDLHKKPHPLATFELFKKYNLVKDN